MNKKLFVVMAGLMTQSMLFCADPKNLFDFSEQEISPEQLMRFAAYKNIMKAGKDAQESAVYKKSLEKFSASFNDLMQTYAQEVAARLNEEEKDIAYGILADVKDMVNLVKEAVPLLNDPMIDSSTKEQIAVEFQNKLVEQYIQLTEKVAPFGQIIQEESANPQEFDKNFNTLMNKVNSFLDSFLDTLKKNK